MITSRRAWKRGMVERSSQYALKHPCQAVGFQCSQDLVTTVNRDNRMSKFVNYKKRNVELPPGCKDLVDVLRSRRRPDSAGVMEADNRPTVSRGGEATGGILEIESMSGWSSRLEAGVHTHGHAADKRFSVHVARMEDGTMWGLCAFKRTLNQRRLCGASWCATVFVLPRIQEGPRFSCRACPSMLSYNISTTPPDATELAACWVVVPGGCGLADDCCLSFCLQ